jgi:cellobiose-specific phosphotransferase system component IIC
MPRRAAVLWMAGLHGAVALSAVTSGLAACVEFGSSAALIATLATLR